MQESIINNLKPPKSMPDIPLTEILACSSLYKGQYCDVKLENKSSPSLAIKVIHKDRISSVEYKRQYILIHNEIKILYLCSHQNIIRLLGHHEYENHIVLFFEKFGQSLRAFVRRCRQDAKNQKRKFTLAEYLRIIQQIGSAINQIHCLGFVHRDISSDNILIDTNNFQIKLCDFGYCAPIRGRSTELGTSQYLAPEILMKKKYTYKVDVWAFGIVCFELLYGIFLFKPKHKVEEDQVAREYLKNMKKSLEKLPDEKLLITQKPPVTLITNLNRLLNMDPQQRPEIGYLLSLPEFGANNDKPDYQLNQFIRNTERKAQKIQNNCEQLEKMPIHQLQKKLQEKVLEHSQQLKKHKQLLLAILQSQKK